MLGPIAMGKKGTKVAWVNFNALCSHFLGYVPPKDTKLTQKELNTLGFVYACGERKLTGTTYGRVYHLL
jgi:hypothetical protein